MPRMFPVTIGGLCNSQVERLVEIMEAGLIARAIDQADSRIVADRKLVDYVKGKLVSVMENENRMFSIREKLSHGLEISTNDILLAVGPDEIDTLRVIFLANINPELVQDVFHEISMSFSITNVVAQVVTESGHYAECMREMDFEAAFDWSWDCATVTIRY